jgi:hypothetical protein
VTPLAGVHLFLMTARHALQLNHDHVLTRWSDDPATVARSFYGIGVVLCLGLLVLWGGMHRRRL